MCQILFSDINRDDDRAAKYGEHTFDYIDSSARAEAKDIRDFLESAFGHYPKEEKIELKKRIQSRDHIQSKAATFELILHELLLNIGHDVIIHPRLKNVKKSPDFLVRTKQGDQFYMEAILACDYDTEQSSLEKEKNRLIDQINNEFSTISNANLWISIVKQSEKAFNKQLLCRDIRSKLDCLQKNSNSHIKWRWESGLNEWIIELQVWKKPFQTGRVSRFVSTIYPQMASLVDVPRAVKGAFRKKSTRYGKLDYPYILAINIDAENLDRIDEMESLFGKEQFIFTQDSIEFIGRQKDGAWSGPNGPQNKRVCGAWLFDNLTLWRLNKHHILYLNPFSDKQINESFYSQLPHAKVNKDKMSWQDGLYVHEILALEWNWLKT